MRNSVLVKPDLRVIVTIAQHACNRILKRGLKLLTYRLQICLVKYEYLRSLNCVKTKAYVRGKLKKPVRKHVLATLTTYMETKL